MKAVQDARTADEKAAYEKLDDAGKKADDQKRFDAAETARKAAAEAANKVPEKYEFKLPDGLQVDAKLNDAFSKAAKDAGLTQAQAQAVMDVYTKDLMPRIAEMNNEAITAIGKEWETASRTDKEFGGAKFDENIKLAHAAMNRFGTPALIKALNETRLGNHPEVIRMLWRIGQAVSEDSIDLGGAGGGTGKSLADKLYGPKT